jgi:hypothetical protein
MSALFDLSILNDNRARYIVVAEAFLPLLLSVCWCCQLFREEVPSEWRAFYSVFYLLVAGLWGLSLFVASINFDCIALILFAVISVVLLMMALYLLFLTHRHHHQVFQFSLVFLCCAIIGIIEAMTSPSSNSYAPMLVSITLTPVAFSAITGLLFYKHHKK